MVNNNGMKRREFIEKSSLEEIAGHGRPVTFRSTIHKSKKVYDRKKEKRAGVNLNDFPALFV